VVQDAEGTRSGEGPLDVDHDETTVDECEEGWLQDYLYLRDHDNEEDSS